MTKKKKYIPKEGEDFKVWGIVSCKCICDEVIRNKKGYPLYITAFDEQNNPRQFYINQWHFEPIED